jgi:hypothetical protein
MPEAARIQSPAVKLPWHDRKLPDNWSAEEVCFFRNWMRELAALNDTLTSTAANRAKLLRKARNIYFKLAYRLTEQIRGTLTQTRSGAAMAVRQ